ncbi:cytochrome B [Cereibacter sphaeroides]|uniref:Cytochrome B n=1 Tax=Cereibacter sphaeroides TaxID=1063 RepID=A0AAX1UHN1_CERSP|nr:cytochrome b/b6 domain-containing protein [Cereibacter sphaeroides]RHZ92308.1 cytochrome B [Cereibacter sphaeroides]
MAKEAPAGYSKMQILLHWAVPVLIVVQFLLGPAMTSVYEGMKTGTPTGSPALAWAHVGIGLLVLVLALWRVGLRFARGVPAPAFEPKTPEQGFLAFVTNELTFFLYLAVLAMPVLGAVGWFYGNGVAASAHASMKYLLILVVAVHVGLTLVHQFVLRDGSLDRMRKAGD